MDSQTVLITVIEIPVNYVFAIYKLHYDVTCDDLKTTFN